MTDEPKTGLITLLLAKFVCCGGLLLFATGGIGGIGLWLSEGGAVWTGGALVALAVVAVIWRRRMVQDGERSAVESARHPAE